MKESYRKGPASHPDPESCVRGGNVADEALTGAHAGQVSSCEITKSGTPTPLSEAEGNTGQDATGEPCTGPAQSQTLSMCGNSMHGNRETLGVSIAHGRMDRSGKADGRTPDMLARRESDDRIVPRKRLNNGGTPPPAEIVEERRSTEENARQTTTHRTQSRASVPSGLARVREAARRYRRARFTALLHHVTVDLLRDSFYALKREAAPGIDGVTWQQYEAHLEDRLVDLHRRVHTGSYRANPSRRVFIPKADGRERLLGIASLEDKIVQQAVATVLTAIYEQDFLGFSYGFRPGRGQHDALDALYVGLLGKKVNWVLDADIQGFFDQSS